MLVRVHAVLTPSEKTLCACWQMCQTSCDGSLDQCFSLNGLDMTSIVVSRSVKTATRLNLSNEFMNIRHFSSMSFNDQESHESLEVWVYLQRNLVLILKHKFLPSQH